MIKDTLEPEWDYKTEYDMDYEDLMDHGMEFTVWFILFVMCLILVALVYSDEWICSKQISKKFERRVQ